MTLRRLAVRSRLLLATTTLVLSIPAGCARFDDSASTPFSPEMTFAPEAQNPSPSGPPSSTTRPTRTPGPCVDQDDSVIATCLDSTGGLVVLPGAGSALVAERRTGKIMKVAPEQNQKPVEIARLDVDAAGDGGLLDLALSPSYDEDGLIYALITTPSDNRVVRLVAGDTPKDVLTGIPKGATGNAGALDFASSDELVVLTGDAGDPGAAQDPGSLAGKLLRLEAGATAAAPPPTVLAAGLGVGGDVCPGPDNQVWIADRTATEDRLQRVPLAGGPTTTMWTWPDRPGVAGCAVGRDFAVVMVTKQKAISLLKVENGAVTTAPSLVAQDRYGSLGGATVAPDGLIWAATVNKDGGQPGPNDERVVRFPLEGGGGGGPD